MLLLAAVTANAAPAATDSKPNIIFILADDLGYGDLGCYGQKLIQTPNLDRMAAEGMRFTQFYAGSTVCAPSRSVLMTGQHTGHTRIRGNVGKGNPEAQMLHPQDVTVAKVLKQAGYATGVIGKWGLGNNHDDGIPTKQGFDYWFGYLSQVHAHNYYPAWLWRNEEKVQFPNVVTPAGEEPLGGYATKRVAYSPDLFARESLQFIERNRGKPFFLYLAVTIPHANNERTRALGDGQEVPDYGIYKNKDWTNQNKGQAAMITRLDTQVGQLFKRLKKLGLDEKTLVLFSSDNGHHKEGGNDPEFFDANGPLRGMKRDLYDGGIRVPFLARWPGHIKGGTVSPHVGYFGDFMATAVELAGVSVAQASLLAKSQSGKLEACPTLDSISFVPALLGKDSEQKKHDYLYWEFFERGFSQAVLME
ncbi:MAG: arylsulfatase, partial [Verrucomicrobia bacterium]|nr:arylsulfatase [Verrucomicrobiota bacterium]